MAISAVRFTVTTSSVQVSVPEVDGDDRQSVLLTNLGAADVFVGGPSVTAAAGFPVAPGASMSLDLGPGDRLFAVSASSVAVAVLASGL